MNRDATGCLAAICLSPLLLAATPSYHGIWIVESGQGSGLAVSFPPAALPGASVLVAPTGGEAASGTLVARVDLSGKGFESVAFLASYELPGGSAHAQCLVDGAIVALLEGFGPQERLVQVPNAGAELRLEVLAEDAPEAGWSVALEGVVFSQQGFDVLYSHDCAGLDAWIEAPRRVRLGVDPDWAELGWPLGGTVTVARRPAGGVSNLALTFSQELPAGLFGASASVDGVPIQVFESGPFPPQMFDAGGLSGRSLELSLHAFQPAQGQASWSCLFDELRWSSEPDPTEDVAAAEADVAAEAPDGAAAHPAAEMPPATDRGGCAAAPAGPGWLLWVLAALVAWQCSRMTRGGVR